METVAGIFISTFAGMQSTDLPNFNITKLVCVGRGFKN